MHRLDKIKIDVYDWPDQYDRDINDAARFISKYASVSHFADTVFPMDSSPGFMPRKDLSHEYDMSKVEDIRDPSMRLTDMDTLQYNVAAENYIKLIQGKLHSWMLGFTDQCSSGSSARMIMASDSCKSIFNMGSVLETDNIMLIKTGLTEGEKNVIDNMSLLRPGVHVFQKNCMLTIDKIMRIVSNIGLAHCYSQLYARSNADKNSMAGSNEGCVNQAEMDMCLKRPLIKLYGGEMHADVVQAHVYDLVVTSTGLRNVEHLKDIIKVCINLQGANTVSRQDQQLIVIICYTVIGRILAWKIASGDMSNMEVAAEQMFANIDMGKKEGEGENKNYKLVDIYGMLLNVDRANEYIDENIIINNIYNMSTDEAILPVDVLISEDIERVLDNILATLKILLSNSVSRCKMCYSDISEHTELMITMGSSDNKIVSVKCHKKEKELDEYLESAHYLRHKGVAVDSGISAGNIKTRINALLAKLAQGKLSEYVTDKNTCYITGQKGGMIMPIIIDAFILRRSGFDTYVNDSCELVLISRWIKNGIVSRPSKMLATELKLGSVLHFNERDIDESQVLRNAGRQIIAGVI